MVTYIYIYILWIHVDLFLDLPHRPTGFAREGRSEGIVHPNS